MGSARSPEIWKAWVTGLRRDYSRRLKSAQAISANGSSYWPTPTASKNGVYPVIRVGADGMRFVKGSFQYSLHQAALVWMLFWILAGELGLAPAKRPLKALYSRPLLMTLQHGRPGSDWPLRLNPRFLEDMMAWPPGWTDATSPVTAYAAWLRHMRSELLRLPIGLVGEGW